VQAAAHYDLSKLYLRAFDIEKSSAARDRAEQENGPFLRRHGDDADFSANRYLVDVPVPDARIQALAAGDPMAETLRDAVRARLAGVFGSASWPWAPLGLLGLLWGVALLGARLAPSRSCQKCGRPACRRCDPGGGPLCGQCVNVYVKKGLVEARDRLRKDSAVKRHARLQKLVARALGVLGGGAGHVWAGWVGRGYLVLVALLFVGALLLFWRGVMPPPHPTPYLLAGKLLVGVPLALLIYLVALRDLFGRTDD
jgi:hypothetical protein